MFGLVITLLAIFSESLGGPLEGRIIGGNEVDIADYPYDLSLQYFGGPYCGATLISPIWAVTAGHCVERVSPVDLAVRAGSSNKTSGGQVIRVMSIILHPEYDEEYLDYNIALLRLGEAVTAENAAPAPLPEADQPIPEGSVAVVSGWGTIDLDGLSTDMLHAVEVPIVDEVDCQDAYETEEFTDRMFCAGVLGIGGKGACSNDAGGPAMVDGVFTGVISWRPRCAAGTHPGIYINVRYFRSWIQQHTEL